MTALDPGMTMREEAEYGNHEWQPESDLPATDPLVHREDDMPCGCDGCMEIAAEDEGVDWWRFSRADRERLRRNSSGDDRLGPPEAQP